MHALRQFIEFTIIIDPLYQWSKDSGGSFLCQHLFERSPNDCFFLGLQKPGTDSGLCGFVTRPIGYVSFVEFFFLVAEKANEVAFS